MPTGGTAQALSSSVRSGRWAVDGAEGPRGHLNHLHKEEKKKARTEGIDSGGTFLRYFWENWQSSVGSVLIGSLFGLNIG